MHQDIRPIGVNDHDLDLFEGQYPVPQGVSYNAYVIMDEKVAVLDTADRRCGAAYMANLTAALEGRKPDYLIISHVEPDHASSLQLFLDQYPDTCLVGNAKTWPELNCYFDLSSVKQLTVRDGETLSLGRHELTFLMTPMVHWPEVMMTWDAEAKTLFSADAFGTFGVQDGSEPEAEAWVEEARRYYFNIVGKFGMMVTKVLQRAAGLGVEMICPLHGPVLKKLIPYAVEKYLVWSSYQPEDHAVLIAYATMHGNTACAARELAEVLRDKGQSVSVVDLARDSGSFALAEAFRCDRLVVASATLDGAMNPFMADFLYHLKSKAFQQRTVALMENGSWAPSAAAAMKDVLSQMKNLTLLEPVVTIRGKLNESSRAVMAELADKLAE